MATKKYKIQYLTSFSDELNDVLQYISCILKNEKAAKDLLNRIMKAINKRSENPKGYEKYSLGVFSYLVNKKWR